MATSGEKIPQDQPSTNNSSSSPVMVLSGERIRKTPVPTPAPTSASPQPPQHYKDLESQHNHFLSADRFNTEITTNWADVLLIACFFASGLTDSAAFTVYGCFIGMQTGNSVFIGLGPSHLPVDAPAAAWARPLMAVVFFLLGALFFSSFHRYFGGLKRWVLVCSFLIQAVLIALPAALITGHVFARSAAEVDGHWINLIPVAMLGFQSAGQIVASRVLKSTLPTIVLTSLYCDLMSDPDLFTAGLFHNANRNRRICGIVALLVGAVAGGFIVKSSAGLEGALFVACGLKLGMAMSWVFWRPKKPNEK